MDMIIIEKIIKAIAAYGVIITIFLGLGFVLKEFIKSWIWSIMLKSVARYHSKQLAQEIKKTQNETPKKTQVVVEGDTVTK